jgi:hypothetical protein
MPTAIKSFSPSGLLIVFSNAKIGQHCSEINYQSGWFIPHPIILKDYWKTSGKVFWELGGHSV